jgi:hypothetical protein
MHLILGRREYFFVLGNKLSIIMILLMGFFLRLSHTIRTFNEVIKGLIFNKYACSCHTHVPTKCHSPRLLLLECALDPCDWFFHGTC